MNGNQGTLLRQCVCNGWKQFVILNNDHRCRWCGRQLAMKDIVYIMCAAIHYDDGKKYEHQPKNIEKGFVVTGWRHHNCILTYSLLSKKLNGSRPENTQGFLTNTNLFVNRSVAYEIAAAAGQIEYREGAARHLISEMVW